VPRFRVPPVAPTTTEPKFTPARVNVPVPAFVKAPVPPIVPVARLTVRPFVSKVPPPAPMVNVRAVGSKAAPNFRVPLLRVSALVEFPRTALEEMSKVEAF